MNKIVPIILSGALTASAGAGVLVTSNVNPPVKNEAEAVTVAKNLSLVEVKPFAKNKESLKSEEETVAVSDLKADENIQEDPELPEDSDDNLTAEERIERNSEDDTVWYHIDKEECIGHQWENVYEVDEAGVYHYSRCCSVCGAVEDLDYCPSDLAWTQEYTRVGPSIPEEKDTEEVENAPSVEDGDE